MKNVFIVLGLFLVNSGVFAEVELEDVVGNYEVTIPDILSATNSVMFAKDGTVVLVEKNPYGTLECEGRARVVDETIVSEVICANGMKFTQVVDMKNISDFAEFTAPLYRSLYGTEVMSHFRRIE